MHLPSPARLARARTNKRTDIASTRTSRHAHAHARAHLITHARTHGHAHTHTFTHTCIDTRRPLQLGPTEAENYMAIAQMSNLVENRFVGVGAVASVLYVDVVLA